MSVNIVLFDFDNTIANTESIKEIRELGQYHLLDEARLSTISVYTPVHNLLDQLIKKKVRLGIVTNSSRKYLEKLLKHLVLSDKFDVVVTYTDVNSSGKKPSPNGIRMALQKLNAQPSEKVLFVGDEYTDVMAAYRAGVTPIMPTWASRGTVSIAPAMELSSEMLVRYIDNPDEYQLFAEKCAKHKTAKFDRENVYFLPLDASANAVTVRGQMTSFCLGRYFSQKTAVTATLHDKHQLSTIIAMKGQETVFNIPDYWSDIFVHIIKNGAEFMFGSGGVFDVVTVIPSKKDKDPRLERLLSQIAEKMGLDEYAITFISDVFRFVDDAKSQKTLGRDERSQEAKRSLQLNEDRKECINGKRILVIDDVITTGATLSQAFDLLRECKVEKAVGLVLAKTVSIVEDERPCPKCGRAMRIRKNATSGERFWGCSGFSDEANECKYTESLFAKICTCCGRAMSVKTNRSTQQKFWGCTGYNKEPACNHSCDFDPYEMPN